MNVHGTTAPAPFVVTHHAQWQAAERFPGFDTLQIEEEVTDGMLAGRVSPDRPPGLHPRSNPASLYVWTEDGERVYALRATGPSFYVTTTMKAVLQ